MLYNIATNFFAFIFKLFFKVQIIGKENIPRDIGIIVSSNHYHWLDPVVLACFFSRPIAFMAKKELFENKILAYLLKKIYAFPVNRQGGDISAIKNALKIVKSKEALGMFPEGTRVKSGEYIVAEPGIAMIGIRGKAKILPVGISGDYKFRSRLFINIGQPVSLEQYYDKKINIEEFQEISEEIMTKVRELIIKI